MSELRIKLLDLAIQAGATIENATKVADDWERWTTEDDPLRLGTPPIASLGRPNEIDWNRPQLVASINGNCVVEVNNSLSHLANEKEFSGRMVDGSSYLRTIGSDYTWSRAAFRYHGEIPKEVHIFNKEAFTMSDMQKCFDESRLTHPMIGFKHDNLNDYLKWLKIQQEQSKESQCANAKDGDGTCGLSCCICAKEEPKTTGLNFLEAIRLLRSGMGVERSRPEKQFLSQYGVKGKKLCYLDTRLFATLNMDDFLATDWQIVKS